MPKIHCLERHVANLIAAGEVVERPASVVKELTENAIDAGATAVAVEIQRGGMGYIRVTDNGCGMEPEDAETAFLRHATSKIQNAFDLEAIGTLGFRGEALAAIAAVARVELMTRTADREFGTGLTLEGGKVVEREVVGCPEGTTMIVRNLFYNTPARLKFMKRDVAEGAAVYAVVQHVALSHPEVSFRFVREGKEELPRRETGICVPLSMRCWGEKWRWGCSPASARTRNCQWRDLSPVPPAAGGTGADSISSSMAAM